MISVRPFKFLLTKILLLVSSFLYFNALKADGLKDKDRITLFIVTSKTYNSELSTIPKNKQLLNSDFIFSDSLPQCLTGNNFNFISKSSISSGGNIVSQNWDFGDGKTATGINVNHSYFSAGTYQVKLKVTSDLGCTDSLTKTVTVYPQPTAVFSIPSNQCLAGNVFSFISGASIANSGSISTQTWNFGDGNTATGGSVTHSYAAAGKYAVNLQVSSNNGCIDLITDSITVYPSPNTTITSQNNICLGNSMSLSATVSGGTSPYKYSWVGPNGFNSNLASPILANVSANATGNYQLTITDSNLCTASFVSALTVKSPPTVAPITGPIGGCVGSGITLSNSTANGVWSSSNPTIATVNSATGQVNFLSVGSTSINYLVSSNGCATLVGITVIANEVDLHPDVIECNNGITHFNATDTYYGVTYSNNNAGNTYLWSINGGPFSYQGSSKDTSQYPSVQLQTGYAFTVRVQFTSAGVSCSAQQKIYKNTVAADTILGSHDTTICSNSAPISLVAAVSAVTNSYHWSSTGTGVFSNSNSLYTSYTPSIADKLAGLVKIYFIASSNITATGSCGSSYGKDSMILRIYPQNLASNSSQTICSNQTINFTPVSSIAGSFYSWSSSISTGTVFGNSASGTGKINDSLINASNSNDAIVVYNITPFASTPNNATCIGNPFNYTVTIKPKPTISIQNNTAAICSGNNTNIQFNSSISGSTYSWTSSILYGSLIGNSSSNNYSSLQNISDLLNNTLNVNSIVRYYLNTNSPSGCKGIDSTDVLIYALPSTANAGPDQLLCNVSSTTLAANIPAIGTGKWSQISGPSTANFGSVNAAFSTVSGLVNGVYQFVWTISNGSCNVSVDTMQLIIAAPSVGGLLSSNASVCAGSNSNTLSLTGYTGNIIYWQYSIDAGNNWTTISSTNNSYTYNNLTQTTLYRVAVQNGNCSIDYSNNITILVHSNTDAGILSKDSIVCINSNSGTLQLKAYIGNVLNWESSTNNGGSWTTINNTGDNYTYNNLQSNTLFRAVVQNAVCASVNSNYVTITVSQTSQAGNLSADAIVCANNNSGTLNLNGNTGNILRWESSTDNGNSWLSINNTSNQFNYNNLSSSTTYRVLVQSGNCPSNYSNSNTITVIQPVTLANAGIDQILCNSSIATLSANTAQSGTGKWTAATGNPTNASILNTADPHSSVTGLTAGSYQFIWTISNGNCFVSTDTVMITINTQTIPGTLNGATTVCSGNNSGNLNLTGFIGNIIQWESSIDNGQNWTIISNHTASQNYSNLLQTTLFRALVQSGSCSAQYSSPAIISVLSAVTHAIAGTNQTLCNTSSVSLSANTAISGTGTWTAANSNPTTVSFTNPNDPNTSVNGLQNGTYHFIWTINNSVCTASSDTTQVVVLPPSNAGILSADATVCAASNNGTLNINGTVGGIVGWESSQDAVNWTNINNTSNTLNYSNLNNTTFYRVAVKNGICPIKYSNQISINVITATSIANAGHDTTLINGFSSYKLQGNTPVSGVGVWTVVPPFGPSNVNITDIYDPNATVLNLKYNLADSTVTPVIPPSDGHYHMKWTITNGICPPSESIMVITVQPPTNPGFVGTDTVSCTGNNSGMISVSSYFGNILQWEDSTAANNSWQIIPRTIGTNQDTIHYENLLATTYYRALVKNGVGLSLYSGIAATVTILDAVTKANAGVDSNFCNTSNVQLYANRPSSGTGTWSANPSNPSAVSFSNLKDPSAVVSGLNTGSYQFIWTISNGYCSSSTDTVTININAPTVAGNLITAATVCANNNSGQLKLNGYTGSIISNYFSTDNGNSWSVIPGTNAIDNFSFNNISTTTQYKSAVKNGACPIVYSNIVTITALQAVSIANAGPDQNLCNQNFAILSGNNPSNGTGTWTSVSNNPSVISFTNIHDPNSTIIGLVTGTYQFIWTISNTLCSDTKDTVQITVYAPSNPGTLASDAIVCANNNQNTLVLSGYSSNILRWESSTDNATTWNNIVNSSNNLFYQNLNTTTAYRTLVQNGNCNAFYSNQVNIQVLQPVTIANAGVDQKLCNQGSTVLAANTASIGFGYWSADSGNPSQVIFSNNADPNTTVSGLIPGNYHFIWTITNTLCNSSSDTVMVVVYPITNPGSLHADQLVCTDLNTGNIQLTNYTGTIVHWEISQDNGSSWTIITSDSDTHVFNNLTTTSLYRVLVQNGPCNAYYSNTVQIIVYPKSTPGILTVTDSIVCSGNNYGSMQLMGYTGTILHWEISEDNGISWTSFLNTSNVFSFSNLTKNTLIKVLVQSGVCTSAYSNIVSIKINQPTVAGILSGNATVCSKSNNGQIQLNGNTGDIIHWESSTDQGVSWNIISNSSALLYYSNLDSSTLYRTLVQNGACATMYTNTVSILVVQPATIANAGNNQVICNQTTITQLQGNTALNGQGIWTLNKGATGIYFTDATMPNATVYGLTPGAYTFTWTIDNGICPATSSNVNIVLDRIKADFSLNAQYNCGSTNYNFTDTSKYIFGIDSWKWSSAAGDTTLSKNYSKSYTLAGQNKMSLTVQSTTGCTSTSSASFQVKVFSVPKVNINAINEACKNQLMQLSPTVISKDSIFSIMWNLGNGINSKDSIVTVQYYNDGKYTVKLLVSTVNNCYDSSYKSLTIHPLPTIIVPVDNYICRGDTLNLQAFGATNYIWMDQQNNIVCDGCTTYKISPTSNVLYHIVGYNQYGCSQILNTGINVVQPFKISANLLDTICIGSSVNLPVSGADNYTWLPVPRLSNYYSKDPVASPITTTTYTVIGRDDHACFTDTAQIKLVVGDPTIFSITKDTAVQAGVQFMLIPVSNDLSNIRTWQWSGNASFNCNNCETTIARVSNDADIICSATNIYGCVVSDTISVKTFCPDTEIFIPNAFTPDGDGINDILFVQGTGIKLVKSFRIYSRWGELVFEKTNFLPGDISQGWDGKIRGKAASQDVFVYICEVVCAKGIPAVFKGNVAVLK